MTVYELSLEYRQTAESLRRRIVELEQAAGRGQMEARLCTLRSMHRDVLAVARHLEHYYDGRAPGRRRK